ncbi:MAG: hypothetical protein JSU04_09055 [Bdellovibrionales bacterium]|nr:hypothetical protein [Bdellovibrionales bacterium]
MKIFTLIFLLSLQTQAAVWTAENSWDASAEKAYSEFVKNGYVTDIFTNPQSEFAGIRTDCADAMYAARIIFAAKNKLPFKVKDPTTTGSFITNAMGRWDSLSESERLREFIKYVGDLSNTGTLDDDTYPVTVTKESFTPGIIYLDPGHHAEMVKSIAENGFIEFIASTSPKMVRDLFSHSNPTHAPLTNLGGFRKWRNPDQYGVPSASLPAYGMDQFRLADWKAGVFKTRKLIFQWHEAIRKILRDRPPTFDERTDVIVESLCHLFTARVSTVKYSWQLIHDRGGKCLRGGELDNHSTTMRDWRIKENFGQLYDLYAWNFKENSLGQGNLFDAEAKLEGCRINYWPEHSATLWELLQRMRSGLVESNANYSPAVRWGERAASGYDCR